MEIGVIVVFSAIALGTSVFSGGLFEQKKLLPGFVFLLIAIISTAALAIYSHASGLPVLSIFATEEKVYVVLKKVPDEKGAFLVLLDTKNNNERVAHLSVYPPEGYSETTLPDGRTVLAVIGRQIVVGNPDKADFVPPKKN